MSELDIEFVVQGTPVPQGSTKSFYLKKLERVVTTHSNAPELRDWRYNIKYQAELAMRTLNRVMTTEKSDAYFVSAVFYFLKPASVKYVCKNTKPDIDKLIRAVLDALTGTCYPNDSRVSAVFAEKRFSTNGREYAIIRVRKMCAPKAMTRDEIDIAIS